MNKSYVWTGLDGAYLRIEETTERDTLVVSVSRDSKVETCRINRKIVDEIREVLPGGYSLDELTCEAEGGQKVEE